MKRTFGPFMLVFLLWTAFNGSAIAQSVERLSVVDCIHIALDDNAQIRNSERQLRMAGTHVTSSRALILPRITSSFSSGRFIQGPRKLLTDVPVGFDPVSQQMQFRQVEIVQDKITRDSHSASVSLSQSVYDGGRWWNSIRQSNALQDAAELDLEATRQNVTLTVISAYYGLLKSIKLLEVYENALESASEQLKRTQSMYEIGSVAQADVYRAQVSEGTARTNLISQRNLVEFNRGNLNLALAREPDSPIEIVEVIPEQPALDLSYEEALKRALAGNPELRALRAQVKSSALGVKVAKAAHLPSLGFSVSYSRFNTEYQRVYSPDLDLNYDVSMGIRLSFEVFNGFATQAGVEQASLSHHIDRENHSARLRTVRQDVRRAVLNMRAYREMAEINKANLKAAEEDMRLNRERYRIGAGTLLEVLDSQVALIREQANFVSIKYDAIIAEAELKAAMGELGSN